MGSWGPGRGGRGARRGPCSPQEAPGGRPTPDGGRPSTTATGGPRGAARRAPLAIRTGRTAAGGRAVTAVAPEGRTVGMEGRRMEDRRMEGRTAAPRGPGPRPRAWGAGACRRGAAGPRGALGLCLHPAAGAMDPTDPGAPADPPGALRAGRGPHTEAPRAGPQDLGPPNPQATWRRFWPPRPRPRPPARGAWGVLTCYQRLALQFSD